MKKYEMPEQPKVKIQLENKEVDVLESVLFCWDCKKVIGKEDEFKTYEVGRESIFFKCRSCFEKEPLLKDFRATEVYSRVCGYLRPLSQWNPGKRAEHGDKKYFAVGIADKTNC